MSGKGWVFKRCACKDPETDKQYGYKRCPNKDSKKHRWSWAFEVDLPPVKPGRRNRKTGSGFLNKKAAQSELDKILEKDHLGVTIDERQTVAEYMNGWIKEQRHRLKPKTWENYERYVRLDIVPFLGHLPLERLRHDHVRKFQEHLEATERGIPTRHRIHATLSSALTDAVEQRRLLHNPAQHIVLPKERRKERTLWTPEQVATFVESLAKDPLAPFFEVAMGTGLRRGEVLGLKWEDADMGRKILHVRRNLQRANRKLVYGEPKTPGSKGGISMNNMTVAALKEQWNAQTVLKDAAGDGWLDLGLVFTREDGSEVRPERPYRRFKQLAKEAGLPDIPLHHLRHLVATLMLENGVPMSTVSKMLRHASIQVTVDLYGHLTPGGSRSAAETLESAIPTKRAAITAPSQQQGKEVISESQDEAEKQETPCSEGVSDCLDQTCARRDSNPKPSDP